MNYIYEVYKLKLNKLFKFLCEASYMFYVVNKSYKGKITLNENTESNTDKISRRFHHKKQAHFFH
ncbi:MAG: hypothetical protein ACI8P3_003790 [Saprospiraceae bacterium]|jgi:hypothetical protein